MLVKYLYENKNRNSKEVLWFTYGNAIVDILKENLEYKESKYIRCVDCGVWFEINDYNFRSDRCEKCYSIYRKKYKAIKEKERRNRVKIVNVDKT